MLVRPRPWTAALGLALLLCAAAVPRADAEAPDPAISDYCQARQLTSWEGPACLEKNFSCSRFPGPGRHPGR